MKTRVYLADFQPVFMKGLELFLGQDPELELSGSTREGDAALEAIRMLHPDVAVVARGISVVKGPHIAATLRREGLSTQVIIISTRCRGEDVFQAFEAGAAGYLSRAESGERFCRAVHDASHGTVAISNLADMALQRHLREQAGGKEISSEAGPSRPLLTARELEVLRYAAHGYSIMETARRLHLSASTVKNHREHVYAKLDSSNAPSAVYIAMRRGLIPESYEYTRTNI